MFTLEPLFCSAIHSSALAEHSKQIELLLEKILPKSVRFEDKADFNAWAAEALPLLKWNECTSAPDSLSMMLLCQPCKELRPEVFFVDVLRKWLIPEKESTILSFQHMLFTVKGLENKYFVAEANVLIEDDRDLYRIKANLPNLSKDIISGISSATYANYIINTKNLSFNHKANLVHQELNSLIRRFPRYIDTTILKEMGRFLALTENEFLDQRTSRHITRMICSQFLIRKTLFKSIAAFPEMRHLELRLLPTDLQFPFGSKPVLGIMIGINLLDKYESFDEEHVLSAVQKFFPETQLGKGASLWYQAQGDKLKTLYVEIEKKEGDNFTVSETHLLKRSLKEELKYRTEKLIPTVFMVRNEEEVLRNILTLSQEIKYVSDLPQVMITLDRQTSSEVIFTIVLVRICTKQMTPLDKVFEGIEDNFLYFSDRHQTVGYLRKKYPIEAHVFRLNLSKDPSLLRADSSLNFYSARQKVATILNQAIGEFRDYNGGIIVKQREILSHLKQAFEEVDKNTPDLLENFFYALNPIEVQATLPLSTSITLFDLFLLSLKQELPKRFSYFLKFHQHGHQTFAIIRARDEQLKTHIFNALCELDFHQKNLISTNVNIREGTSLGLIFDHPDIRKHEAFVDILQKAMDSWAKKIENLQILRLCVQFNPTSQDPRIGGDGESRIILRMLFEGLMRVNNKGALIPGIAESVDISADSKRYIFKLRKSYWSNGDIVLAYDFEYAWKTSLSPHFKTPFAYLFYPIKNAKEAKEGRVSIDEIGVKAIDDFTLEVNLSHVAPYFLTLTAQTLYSPINHRIDKIHPNWPLLEQDAYVCNGAFRLKKNSSAHGYELVKNQLYWDAEDIKIDQVNILKTSSHQAYQLFKQNEIDWLGYPIVVQTHPIFSPGENDEFISFSPNGVYWYVFNTMRFPFHNSKLRRAFSYAISRSQLINLISREGRPALSPLPESHAQKPNALLLDVQKQKALELFESALKELGLTRQTFPLISLTYLQETYRKEIAEILKKQWEEFFGIHIREEAHEEWESFFKKMTQGEFQLGGMNWSPWFDDPIYTLNAFKRANDPINFPKWENHEYQQLLDLADHEVDNTKRLHLLAQAEEILLEEMPVIPLVYPIYKAVRKKHLDNPIQTLAHYDFKWTSIAKKS